MLVKLLMLCEFGHSLSQVGQLEMFSLNVLENAVNKTGEQSGSEPKAQVGSQ